MQADIKNVFINWDDEKDIKSAEKAKSDLENNGYSLVRTISGFDADCLVYRKFK